MTAEYIYTHECAYNFLLLYFLPELSDPLFRRDAAAEIAQNERLAYCRHMAAWLPYQPHYDQIIQHIYDQEDAATRPLFTYIQFSMGFARTPCSIQHASSAFPNAAYSYISRLCPTVRTRMTILSSCISARMR